MLTNCFNGYPIHLIESVEELHKVVSTFDPKIFVGLDTETHSLTYAPEQVVGVCISGGSSYSTSDYHGYYIPLRHREYENLPLAEVIPVVQNLLDNYQTVFFNRNFDASQLEYDGIKIPFVGKMHDAQVMCFLVFNEHYPSLKEYTKNILKWKVIDFETITGGDHDFGNSDPRMSFQYACFTPDTKFLTKSGFKTYDEIQAGESVAQWNPTSNEIEFVTPLRRIDTFSERIIENVSGRVSISVSDNHRVARAQGKVRHIVKTEAKELYGKTVLIPTSSAGYSGTERVEPFYFPASLLVGGRNGKSIHLYDNSLTLEPNAFISMLGFFLADGSCNVRARGWDLKLFQADIPKKSKQLKFLRNLNKSLGNLFTESQDSDRVWELRRNRETAKSTGRMVCFTKVHKSLCHWVKSQFYNEFGEKQVPRWVFELSVAQRKRFIYAYFLADGSKQEDRRSWHIDVCNNKILAEQILELVVSVGYTCKMSHYSEDRVAFGKQRHKDCYRIHVNPHIQFSVALKQNWREKGQGRVVCFTVPSGFLLVQRDYKTCISGNCGDPIMNVFLARAIWSRYPDIRKIYSIDNYALEAVRRMMQQTLTLDYDFVQSEYDRTSDKLRSIQEQIYTMTGVHGFNIGSAKEKADVLSRFVTLTKKTKSGGFATDADTLESIDHPVAKLMVQWNETRTYLNSFLKKILTFKGRDVRINYSTVNVASGRLSSGASKGNDYYVPLNIQNQPKLEEKLYVHHHEHLGYCLKREKEGCVLDKDGNPCKLKTKTGLHEAYITGDPDWVWLTGDYCLHPHMRVTTEFGERTLEQLYNMPKGTKVLTPKGFCETYNVRYTGFREQITIELETGETLVCSPEHRIAVERETQLGWVRASELRDTDRVITDKDKILLEDVQSELH